MIHLSPITEENFLRVMHLSVAEDQKGFLSDPVGILARGYVYRDHNARVWAICHHDREIGLALVRDMTEEPACYELQQFMIDAQYQGHGYGYAALKIILSLLQEEGRFSSVEVCVNCAAVQALRVYQKAGFVDTGYVDESLPNCRNLRFSFA